jgi:hypothetical protein
LIFWMYEFSNIFLDQSVVKVVRWFLILYKN